MKKITVILAACAMFAFAACNKENEKGYTLNDDNTFNIVIGTTSPEDADNGGKQALHGERMQILFTTGDQIMVNEDILDISVLSANIAGLPSGVSNRAGIYGITMADQYKFYFTAATYTVIDGQYKVAMLDEVDLLGNAVSNAFGLTNQAWPMYAEFTDPAEIGDNGLLLRNAVAVLSPAVVYGTGWADVAFASFYPAGHSFLPTDLPEVIVTDVVINSTNKMTGTATLHPHATRPYITLDGEPLSGNERDKVTCHIPEANQLSLMAPQDQRAVINVLGNLPVAPAPAYVTYQLNIYFHATINGETKYYKFQTVDVENEYPTLRNKRDWLQINFQTVSSTTVPVVVTASTPASANPNNYPVGSIIFSNGVLFPPADAPYDVL